MCLHDTGSSLSTIHIDHSNAVNSVLVKTNRDFNMFSTFAITNKIKDDTSLQSIFVIYFQILEKYNFKKMSSQFKTIK